MSAAAQTTSRDGLLHIGAVCNQLRDEFPDVSISKIRYLEDQGLIHPKRTQGGYRLFDDDTVERLRTILRLQRDEFLPLRVIRQELASPEANKARRRRRAAGLAGPEEELSAGEIEERSGATPQLVRELEEYGLLAPRVAGGERFYSETDAEIAAICGRLAGFGIAPRHLRTFRTSTDRETGLLESAIAPALRSRNLERRAAALEDLEGLAVVAQELAQLLLMRDLREVAER